MRRMLSALVLLVPLGGMAQEPSYTHIEGGLSSVSPPGDIGSSDTGLRLRGSMALDAPVFIRGGLSFHNFSHRAGPPGDRRTSKVDREVLAAGVGLRFPTEQPIDFYGAADVLFDFGEADDAGFRLEGGAKTVLNTGWDSTGGLRFERFDSDSFIQLFANTWHEIAPELSLGGELAVGDFDEILLGARYRY